MENKREPTVSSGGPKLSAAKRSLWGCALICSLLACEEPSERSSPPSSAPLEDLLALTPPPPDQRPRSASDGGEPALSRDQETADRQGSDLHIFSQDQLFLDQRLERDQGVAYPINDCESACAQFTRCELLESRYPLGGEPECLTRCARAQEGRELALYF